MEKPFHTKKPISSWKRVMVVMFKRTLMQEWQSLPTRFSHSWPQTVGFFQNPSTLGVPRLKPKVEFWQLVFSKFKIWQINVKNRQIIYLQVFHKCWFHAGTKKLSKWVHTLGKSQCFFGVKICIIGTKEILGTKEFLRKNVSKSPFLGEKFWSPHTMFM